MEFLSQVLDLFDVSNITTFCRAAPHSKVIGQRAVVAPPCGRPQCFHFFCLDKILYCRSLWWLSCGDFISVSLFSSSFMVFKGPSFRTIAFTSVPQWRHVSQPRWSSWSGTTLQMIVRDHMPRSPPPRCERNKKLGLPELHRHEKHQNASVLAWS